MDMVSSKPLILSGDLMGRDTPIVLTRGGAKIGADVEDVGQGYLHRARMKAPVFYAHKHKGYL